MLYLRSNRKFVDVVKRSAIRANTLKTMDWSNQNKGTYLQISEQLIVASTLHVSTMILKIVVQAIVDEHVASVVLFQFKVQTAVATNGAILCVVMDLQLFD